MEIVYHGSPTGNMKEIKSHISTHRENFIYASKKKVVALLFMGKGKGDLDTIIPSIDGNLVLVERREGVLDSWYNKEGYLYELDGKTFYHPDYLWVYEVVSKEDSIKPLKEIYYPNILDELEKEEKDGNITIYRYPNRPKQFPVDNSDLIEKYINYENNGIKHSIDMLLETYPEFTDKVKEYMNYNKKF